MKYGSMSAQPFKSTEIGELPTSWEVMRVGDVFDVQQGKALSPLARRGASPHPFLRTANVLWGRLALSEVDQMDFSEEEAEKLRLKPGDLLVCEGGEIGRSALWKGELEGCLYQNHIHRLRTNNAGAWPHFVMYWMQAAFLHLGLYGGVGNRTTIPNLSGARLKQLPIPLPPFPEQRAIAGVLAKIQAAVEVQEKIVVTLKELKAATMAKLFHDGLRVEQLKETEVGEIPESWKVVLLGELCTEPDGFIQTGPFGSQLHASDYMAEGIPIVNPTHIDDEHINHEGIPRISKSDADRLQRHRLRTGDILFSRRGDVGRHAHVFGEEQGWLCGTGCLIVRASRRRIYPLYLTYFLSTQCAQEYLKSQAVGSIMPNINTKVLAAVPVAVPPYDEQQEIAETLRFVDKRVQREAKREDVLRSLFSSMLHRLMTGRVRVTRKMIALQALEDRRKRRPKWSGKVDEKVLEEIVRRIVQAVAPEKIILFGSAARGQMGPDSDLDLLVVTECENRRETARVIRRKLIGIGIPIDVIVATPGDVARHKDTIGLIYRPALREGRIVYAA